MAKRKVKKQAKRARKSDPFDVLTSLPMMGLYAIIFLIIGIFMLR